MTWSFSTRDKISGWGLALLIMGVLIQILAAFFV